MFGMAHPQHLNHWMGFEPSDSPKGPAALGSGPLRFCLISPDGWWGLLVKSPLNLWFSWNGGFP